MNTTSAAPQSTGRLIWQSTKHTLKYIGASLATLILTFLACYIAASVSTLLTGDVFLNADTVAGVVFGVFLMSLYWVPAFFLILPLAFPIWLFTNLGAQAYGLSQRVAATTACVISWLTAFTIFVAITDGYAVKPWTSKHAVVLVAIALIGTMIAYRIFRPKASLHS